MVLSVLPKIKFAISGAACAFRSGSVAGLLLAITSCVHGPSAQDQADLQLVAVAVEQSAACVPQEQAQQAQAALGRLGVSLSAQAQARAIWEAAGQVAGAVWPWVLERVARPPP